MKYRGSRSYEWLVYLLAWMLVLLFPVADSLLSHATGGLFPWSAVWWTWLSVVPFVVLFLLHDLLLVPRLFLARRYKEYLTCVVIAMLFFGSYQYLSRDWKHALRQPEQYALFSDRVRLPPVDDGFQSSRHEWDPQPPEGGERPPREPHQPETGKKRVPLPLVMDTVIALLMLGGNLAVVLLFRYQREKERNRELETSHLQHELEYLKAQLNPHFFMNMLNNIHGMVEVDPSRAQEMILGLSKLMRYVLYEGTNSRTSFTQEVKFIDNYVALMRQRYSDRKVRIEISLPDCPPGDLAIPPLLFIVFIENAFKHGISYRQPSFIEIGLAVEETAIRFRCRNSNIHRGEPDRYRGVGLENVRKRLDLLYGDTYTLHIDDLPEVYTVTLIIPRL